MRSIVFVGVLLALWGCADSGDDQKVKDVEHESPSTEKGIKDTSHEGHETYVKAESLVLHDGKKWKVTDEMMPIIISAQDALFEFAYENYTEYNYLGERLNNYNYSLISNCNMKGPSHDALHFWLVPHMEFTDALENAESAEEADRIIEKLQESFRTFHVYFE